VVEENNDRTEYDHCHAPRRERSVECLLGHEGMKFQFLNTVQVRVSIVVTVRIRNGYNCMIDDRRKNNLK
jgi:hypothetical protein